MSDVAGVPNDATLAILQKQLEALSAKVADLQSRQSALPLPPPPKPKLKCLIIMPFGDQPSEKLYREFIVPALHNAISSAAAVTTVGRPGEK